MKEGAKLPSPRFRATSCGVVCVSSPRLCAIGSSGPMVPRPSYAFATATWHVCLYLVVWGSNIRPATLPTSSACPAPIFQNLSMRERASLIALHATTTGCTSRCYTQQMPTYSRSRRTHDGRRPRSVCPEPTFEPGRVWLRCVH